MKTYKSSNIRFSCPIFYPYWPSLTNAEWTLSVFKLWVISQSWSFGNTWGKHLVNLWVESYELINTSFWQNYSLLLHTYLYNTCISFLLIAIRLQLFMVSLHVIGNITCHWQILLVRLLMIRYQQMKTIVNFRQNFLCVSVFVEYICMCVYICALLHYYKDLY